MAKKEKIEKPDFDELLRVRDDKHTERLIDFRSGKLFLYFLIFLLFIVLVLTVLSALAMIQEINNKGFSFNTDSFNTDRITDINVEEESSGWMENITSGITGWFKDKSSDGILVEVELSDEQIMTALDKYNLEEKDIKKVQIAIQNESIKLNGVYTKVGETKLEATIKPQIKNGALEAPVTELKVGIIAVPGFLRNFLSNTMEKILLSSVTSDNVTWEEITYSNNKIKITGHTQ
ncbi:MAG: hypothetical protein ABIE68_03175 [bacterium]